MNTNRFSRTNIEVKSKKRKWLKIFLIFLGVVFLVGGLLLWKAGSVFNKVSTNGSFFSNIVGVLPGVNDEVKGEQEDRINILLLGMRGAGGDVLADTIIVASVKPKENKVSMLSIPRDLYVDNPALGAKSKLNAVYVYGEKEGKGKGIEEMKKVIGEITGLEIHYAGVIDFQGFSDLVDALGGVDVTLSEPFSEPLQFHEEKVCDGTNGGVFTVPSGNYEYKKNEKGKIVAQYPLCYNAHEECGGEFYLPAGTQTLDGAKALCYVRARKTSSDFERAKRQQLIIQKIKEKAFKLGTLTNFDKVNAVIDSLGNNAQTDMQLWEMKRIFELYQGMSNPQIINKVLETNEEGLLYYPSADRYPGAGSIVLPIGDNYSRIQDLAKNIFGSSQTNSGTSNSN